MTSEENMMQRVKLLLRERGTKSLEFSQQTILREKIAYQPLYDALSYFMKEVWLDFLHPALLSISCEAVGGNAENTIQMGAAIVLLAGGADVHDDIIDQSITKGSKPTVFGKFGKDIAILAGDALLFKGLYLLNDAIRRLPDEKRRQILESVKEAFLGVSSAEAKEAGWRGRTDLSGEEYLDIIKMKVGVAQATARLGAILGDGTVEEIEMLSRYGRTFGILNTVRDEYIDVFEADELKNRAKKECLPLPILVTFKDPEKKAAILQLLKQPLTEKNMEKILDLTMDSAETRNLTEEMKTLMRQELQLISSVKSCQVELKLLLTASVENL